MFAKLKLGRLRRRLRKSLAADSNQRPGWEDWLERVPTVEDLRGAADPGWLVHVAFWSDVPNPRIFAAAVEAVKWLEEQPTVELPIEPDEWDELRKVAEVGVDEFLELNELLKGIAVLSADLDNEAPVDRAPVRLDEALRADTVGTVALLEERPRRGGSLEARVAATFLMVSAVHSLAGRADALGEALGAAMALLGVAFGTLKPQLTKQFRAALGW